MGVCIYGSVLEDEREVVRAAPLLVKTASASTATVHKARIGDVRSSPARYKSNS